MRPSAVILAIVLLGAWYWGGCYGVSFVALVLLLTAAVWSVVMLARIIWGFLDGD